MSRGQVPVGQEAIGAEFPSDFCSGIPLSFSAVGSFAIGSVVDDLVFPLTEDFFDFCSLDATEL